MSKVFFLPPGKKLLWILVLILLSGCGIPQVREGRLQPPQITLEAIKIRPPTGGCWPLSVTLGLTNPNPEPLLLLGYDYEVSLAGQNLIRGESASRLVVPAQGTASLEVPILLNLKTLPQALGPVLLGARVPYEIAGGMRLGQILGGLRFPFRVQGELTQTEGLHYLQDYLGPAFGGGSTLQAPR